MLYCNPRKEIYKIMLYTYDELKEYIGKGKNKISREILNNTTARLNGDAAIFIKYHDTDILQLCNGAITYNTGRWFTSTTKERLNMFMPDGWQIYQEANTWYIHNYKTQDKLVYKDNCSFSDGQWCNVGDESDSMKVKILRKKINAYTEGFIKALLHGKVNKPNGGDCWHCHLVDNEGKAWGDKDTRHFLYHMKQKYYVSSLLYNAIKAYPMSIFSNSILGILWGEPINHEVTEWDRDILSRDCKRSLNKYLYEQFNLVR